MTHFFASPFASNPIFPWADISIWTPYIYYSSTQPTALVAYEGAVYLCIISHLSGATFDSSKWMGLSGVGGSGSPATVSYVDTQISNLLTLINSIIGSQQQNVDSVPLVFGQPVCVEPTGIVRADATTINSSRVFGLVSSNQINIGGFGAVTTTGVMTNTITFWNQVIMGATTGLIPDQYYFLDPANPGYITTTVPTTTGVFMINVGLAISTTEFEVNINDPILL